MTTTCPLYTKGLYIEKLNASEAQVSMCCFQTSSRAAYTNINFDNNPYLESLRNKSSTQYKIKECEGCWANESVGNQSYRQGQIQAFNALNLANNSNKELISLTYNCQNTCNLKCITCGPRYSSLWIPEYKKLNLKLTLPQSVKKSYSLNNRCYEDLDFSKLRLLHFQGGEPFLTTDHENVLEKAARDGSIQNLTVSYNTNGTVFPSNKAIELWSQCHLVKIFFSIDGVGKPFEYIRFPGVWAQAEETMLNIRNIGLYNIWIELGITISLANVFYLQDIINWKNQIMPTTASGDPVGSYTNFVGPLSHGGTVLDIATANDTLQQHILEYTTTLTDKNLANSIQQYIKNCDVNNSWIEYLDNLDLLRNTNWRTSLSRLSDKSLASNL
jgi:hypothetical protein